jgi:DNA-3-methyladenine glycosylase
MFGPPGHAYIYLIYGMYHCFNVVTEPEGIGSAVLIRAIEPIANVNGRTQGPGLVCKSMHIDKQLNGADLLSDTLFITNAHYEKPLEIIEAPRIGVAYAKEWAAKLLRFYIKDNPFVSKTVSL